MTAVDRAYRNYDRAKLVLLVYAVVMLTAALGLLVTNSVTARDARAKQVATTALIRSCVDPDGQCFQEAAQRQADIIGDPPAPINNVIILAAACADRAGVDTEAEIRDCVLEGLR